MNTYMKLVGVAVGLTAAAGCEDFLTGTGLTVDPNFPTETPTMEQLAVATQVRLFMNQEGQVARTAAIWTQQLAGINNQQRDYGSRYDYSRNELNTNTAFNNVYQAGGLVNQRELRELAVAGGETRFEAMAMFLEAFTIGTATSVWGDIPYREAIDPANPAPAIDPQEQIYADVQALLSEAITRFQGVPTAAVGQDLVYGGNTDRWIAAAHTLKARYYLHVAPRVGAPAYQNALEHARQGILEAPASEAEAIHGQAAGDFRSRHGTTLNIDANTWANFLTERADIAANRRMIDILQQRGDPRLAAYHAPTASGEFRGSNQFGTGGHAQPWSLLSATRTAFNFRQPLITWAENQLIMAEANLKLNNPGEAMNHLNAVRAAVGLDPHPGPVTLEEIAVEKWIVMFQNADVFTDWRRTCFPRLIPGGSADPEPDARVPGRYVYGQVERQQNPNFAELAPAQQPADNWNFREHASCPAGNLGGEAYPAPDDA